MKNFSFKKFIILVTDRISLDVAILNELMKKGRQKSFGNVLDKEVYPYYYHNYVKYISIIIYNKKK